MKLRSWLPVAVFLGVSIPVVLVLNATKTGGDFTVWIALAAGMLAMAVVQAWLGKRGEETR
ncbi:MAG: hypothetical protein U1F25_05685 [Rubrivivax sp.]